jgi:hypothetical protein
MVREAYACPVRPLRGARLIAAEIGQRPLDAVLERAVRIEPGRPERGRRGRLAAGPGRFGIRARDEADADGAHRLREAGRVHRLIDRELDETVVRGIVCRNLLGIVERLLLELGGREHAGHEARRHRLLRGDEARREQQLLRLPETDVVIDGEVVAVGGQENRVLRGEDEIHRGGDHPAAEDALAVNHRDHRLRQVAPSQMAVGVDVAAQKAAIVWREMARHLLDVVLLVLRGQIVPRREDPAVTGEDDDPALRIVVGGSERAIHLLQHREILRVQLLRPVEDDARDAARPVDDRPEIHRRSSFPMKCRPPLTPARWRSRRRAPARRCRRPNSPASPGFAPCARRGRAMPSVLRARRAG